MNNCIMAIPEFTATQHQTRMLTGVRGIAAFWVVFAHLAYRKDYNAGFGSYEHFGWLAPIIRFDFLAVDFFFILSGCLLYLAYRNLFEQRVKSKVIDLFFLQRLARIYPMHLVGIALIGIYHLLGIPHPLFSGNENILLENWKPTLAANLFLVQAWGIIPGASWNEPAWTVSAMAFVYVLFPNIVGLLRVLPDTPRANCIMIAVCILGYTLARNIIPGLSQSDGTGALLRSISFFATGCFTARLYTLGIGFAWRWQTILSGLILLGVAGMIVWFKLYTFPITSFHFLYPIFMLCLLRAEGWPTYLLTNKLSFFLGKISYSLYILHYPVLLLLKFWLGDAVGLWVKAQPWLVILLYPATVGILVGVAWGATRCIEVPLLRFFKKRIQLMG